MKKIAGFILSGYGRAVLCIASTAWVATFAPLAGMFSSAAFALTALEWGPQRAAIVMMLSTAALAALFAAASGFGMTMAGYESVFLFALLQWLPIAVIAQLLRTTRSLSFTLNMMAAAGLVVVTLVSWLVPDSAELWDKFFNWMLEGAMQREEIAPGFSENYQALLKVMTGIAMASLMLVWAVSLLLARWWQSLLEKPGGFRTEFTGLKLGRAAAVAAFVLFAAMMFSELPLMRELLLVMMSVFLFQGIAVIHCLLGVLKSAGGWLVVFYALLALSPMMPQVPGFLSMVGALENFVGLRTRLLPKPENNKE